MTAEPPGIAEAFEALKQEAEEADAQDPIGYWRNARPEEKARAIARAGQFRAAVKAQEEALNRPLTDEETAQLAMIANAKKPNGAEPTVKAGPVNGSGEARFSPDAPKPKPTDGLQVLDWAAMTANPPAPPPVFRPGVPKIGVTLLAGSPKVGKTLLAGQWALESGEPTLMVIEEGGIAGIVYRLTRQAAGLGKDEPPIRLIHRARVRLDDRKSVLRVREVVASFRPRLVLFDPLNRLHNSDENKPMAMTAIMDNLSAIAQDFRCAVLVIHHLSKPSAERRGDVWDRFRGASSIRSATDANLAMDGSSSDKVRLVGEFRDAEPLYERLSLDRERLLFRSGGAEGPDSDDDDYDGPGGTLADAITEVLARGHATPDEIADSIGEPNNKVRAILSRYKHRFGRLPSGKWELLPEPVE